MTCRTPCHVLAVGPRRRPSWSPRRVAEGAAFVGRAPASRSVDAPSRSSWGPLPAAGDHPFVLHTRAQSGRRPRQGSMGRRPQNHAPGGRAQVGVPTRLRPGLSCLPVPLPAVLCDRPASASLQDELLQAGVRSGLVGASAGQGLFLCRHLGTTTWKSCLRISYKTKREAATPHRTFIRQK